MKSKKGTSSLKMTNRNASMIVFFSYIKKEWFRIFRGHCEQFLKLCARAGGEEEGLLVVIVVG